MSQDRKPIYLRSGVKGVLNGRRDDLSTVINQVAERYGVMVASCQVDLTDQHMALLKDAFAVYREPLDLNNILGFPSVAKTYLRMHSPGQDTDDIVEMLDNMSVPYLVALIDKLERTT